MMPTSVLARLVRSGALIVLILGLTGGFGDVAAGKTTSESTSRASTGTGKAVRSEAVRTAKAAKALPNARALPNAKALPSTGIRAVGPASLPAIGGVRPARPVSVPGLSASVLDLALGAATCAATRGVVRQPSTLTVIDYSKPSTEPRFWVIDLARGDVLYRELVAHGKNTGGNLASEFSNEPGSLKSSFGLFVTRDTYVGSNGYSLRLDGLEKGVNDRALERAIVMHGAPYVNEQTTAALGRLGRSWGCPALRASISREVIDRIKGGNLVFAYYPDQNWLSQSSFLGNCG